MAKPPRYTFTETDAFALRYAGWRISPSIDTADRAWPGGIVATVRATGRWALVENGEQVAIGAGENPVVSALAAMTAAETVKARRLLAKLA